MISKLYDVKEDIQRILNPLEIDMGNIIIEDKTKKYIFEIFFIGWQQVWNGTYYQIMFITEYQNLREIYGEYHP